MTATSFPCGHRAMQTHDSTALVHSLVTLNNVNFNRGIDS